MQLTEDIWRSRVNNYQLRITNCQLRITNGQLSITNIQLQITARQSLLNCYLYWLRGGLFKINLDLLTFAFLNEISMNQKTFEYIPLSAMVRKCYET